jgi:hypothetical protein
MTQIIINYFQDININKNKIKFRSSSLFYLILTYLNINIEGNANPFLDYVSSVLILNIIILLGTINIVFYLLSNYLILNYDIENKFPRLNKNIKIYEKSSVFFIILEMLLVFGSLLFIIYGDITIIKKKYLKLKIKLGKS